MEVGSKKKKVRSRKFLIMQRHALKNVTLTLYESNINYVYILHVERETFCRIMLCPFHFYNKFLVKSYYQF